MKYTPKPEAQLIKEGLLPEGTYDFEIIETDDRPSKKGNEMITLKLSVFDHDGNQRIIFDYISLGNNFGERKLRHAAAACGLLDAYESGQLTDRTFLGATGKIILKQQDGTAEFPFPKNSVSDYLPRDDPRSATEIINDDIPF